jgi:hypothetical protein
MIYLYLIGGLGNQLFQIAYAIELSRITGKKIIVDTSSFESYKIRSYALHYLNLDGSFEVGKIKYRYITLMKIYRVYQWFLKKILRISCHGKLTFNFLNRLGLVFNFDRFYYPFENNNTSDLYVYGYFQSERYFLDSKDEVSKLITLKSDHSNYAENLIALINNSNSIALSMRLGDDYKNSTDLNVCDVDYYLDSIDQIKTGLKFTKDEFTIFVFSDDIVAAKDILVNREENFVFIDKVSAHESLLLMSYCDHFIIPNSSFSWWGAYLGKNESKKVIYPRKWYNNMAKCPDIINDF